MPSGLLVRGRAANAAQRQWLLAKQLFLVQWPPWTTANARGKNVGRNRFLESDFLYFDLILLIKEFFFNSFFHFHCSFEIQVLDEVNIISSQTSCAIAR